MHATAIVLASGSQRPPSRRRPGSAAQGETRVCGEVKTQRTSPPACDTVMRIGWAGEEFDVVIPAVCRPRTERWRRPGCGAPMSVSRAPLHCAMV